MKAIDRALITDGFEDVARKSQQQRIRAFLIRRGEDAFDLLMVERLYDYASEAGLSRD